MIPYGRQSIEQSDIDAVVATLRSDFLTQGPVVPIFEDAVATLCNVEYGVAVNSGTSALHIACLALGLTSGDWLWTSPNSFVASANCGLYCGAKVDFVDIDSRTYNMSPQALEAKLVQAKEKNCLPKIVIPVHFSGQACDMEAISKLALEYDFNVVEDATHAIGGKYQGYPIGDCRYSDITVFSFHPVKIVTTGEGGMALTNDQELANKMARFRSHGIVRTAEGGQQDFSPTWYYEQIDLGLNYRMTEIAAALGLSQLKRLKQFVDRRREISTNYNKAFANLPLILPWQNPESASAWHLYVIQLDSSKTTIDRVTLFNQLRSSKIAVNVHYIPIHTQPYYKALGFKLGSFPEAEEYYSRALSLPIYASLSDENQEKVILGLSDFF